MKIGLAIWGNHAIRTDGGIHGVEDKIVPVDEIFRLQDMAGVKDLEKKFLR